MLHDFLDSMKPNPAQLNRHNLLPFLGIIGVVFLFYVASMVWPAGWVTYFMSTVSLFVMILTAWARLSDIKENTPRYQIRRLGLVLVISACTGIAMKPWLGTPDWPSWSEVMLRVGVAFVWVTTPMMPPWDRYISGNFRKQVVEVGQNVEVQVVRTDTVAGGGMFEERRRGNPPPEDGP